MATQFEDFGMSYSLALQKTIGEVKRSTRKYDGSHDNAHTAVDWITLINLRTQTLHALVSISTGPEFDVERYEKELLATAALAVAALAAHERAKGRQHV